MTLVLGLTGSIGMGKSTAAAMFARAGLPVWDADGAVHQLYAAGAPGAQAVARAFPGVLGADGAVDRARLRAALAAEPGAVDRLNAVVHPLVAEDRARFLAGHAAAPVVLLDVPLLFETGLDAHCHAVAVASAPYEVQRARVLARGLTEAEFLLILSRQMPDAEKRARADYVIPSTSLEAAEQAVKDILSDLDRRIARNA
jgi:dephospho-CoA kinase